MHLMTEWQPSKFVFSKGQWVASRDPREVGIGSRLMGDLIAACYQEALPRWCSGRLIDLGCGQVPLFGEYGPYVTEVLCADWGCTFHRSPYLDLECDLTFNLPLKDDSFDTVLLSDVLEHIPNPGHLWQELARILSPGGRVLLNVPFFYWLHETPYDYYRYTEYALRQLAAEAGFIVLELRPLGGAPEVLADFFSKNLVRVPGGKAVSAALQSLTGQFVRAGPGHRLSERTARQFPLGYFMVAERRSSAL